MSKSHTEGAGALYRYFAGELRRVRAGVTIPNAICFSPDGRRGYFADSREHRIYTWALDAAGWPTGEPELFYDLAGQAATPDGAVVDSQGTLWCALWGGGRVVRIGTDGRVLDEIPMPASRVTCPAFGGDLRDLYVTSAQQGMDTVARAAEPLAGATFHARIDVPGLTEPKVALD